MRIDSCLSITLVIVSLAGSSALASAAPAGAQKETTLELPAKKGQITSIGNLNSKTREDCTATVGAPQIMVLKVPDHGRFEVGLVQTAVPNSPEVPADCKDRQVPGIGMFYAPDDDFVGTDSVEFQFTGQNGAKFLVKLNVQ